MNDDAFNQLEGCFYYRKSLFNSAYEAAKACQLHAIAYSTNTGVRSGYAFSLASRVFQLLGASDVMCVYLRFGQETPATHAGIYLIKSGYYAYNTALFPSPASAHAANALYFLEENLTPNNYDATLQDLAFLNSLLKLEETQTMKVVYLKSGSDIMQQVDAVTAWSFS